jgi:GH24 family phage-related lysozyme (muramidase)
MTQSIQLTDVIAYYKGLEHQKAAIAFLQNNLPQTILDKFTELWRTAPKDEPSLRRSINQAGLNFIKDFEGCILEAYKDAVGVLTIGYGHTQGVTWEQRITQKEAEEFLKEDLNYFENSVSELVKVPLSDNQFAALVSFTFNVGAGALTSSTLLRLLNSGDYQGASNQFQQWIYGDGKVLAGLVRRRTAERDLFLTS